MAISCVYKKSTRYGNKRERAPCLMQPKITIVLLTEVFIIRVADINMRSTYQCCCRSHNSDQTIMSPNKSRKRKFFFCSLLLTYNFVYVHTT